MTAPHPWTPAGGARFFLLDPAPELIDFRDLAESLAKESRFVGHTPGVVYSVAQHSILVADQLPLKARPYGLLHDAHETFLGDIPSPAKAAIRILADSDPIEALAARLDAAIFTAAGLAPPSDEIRAAIKHADAVALATEKRCLLADNLDWPGLPSPLNRAITPWPWPRAMDEFYDRCLRWLPALSTLEGLD